MLDTFWAEKPDGTPRQCSKYFQDVERKRRSDSLVIDILNDEDTFAYECDLRYEDHLDAVEAGEESGECADCCARVSTENRPKRVSFVVTHNTPLSGQAQF